MTYLWLASLLQLLMPQPENVIAEEHVAGKKLSFSHVADFISAYQAVLPITGRVTIKTALVCMGLPC